MRSKNKEEINVDQYISGSSNMCICIMYTSLQQSNDILNLLRERLADREQVCYASTARDLYDLRRYSAEWPFDLGRQSRSSEHRQKTVAL